MTAEADKNGLGSKLLRFWIENKPVTGLVALVLVAWGVFVAPFDWRVPGIQRDPVPVDAIPDTGDNQQIVFTDWRGHSPQDVEDQVTYPLSVALLGVPGVRSIRSSSMFGFSSITVVFDDDVEFYWSRSRIQERLGSLPAQTLPGGVQPRLGPDATSLGQVFWYTLEGRDEDGNAAGGWDLHELRSIQDWQVRYALAGVEGVAEVASIGGYVQEYQIDVDPDAMRAHGVSLEQVFGAVRSSNLDVGARTIEVNGVEYVLRGLGLIEDVEDLENVVVRVRDHVPITIREIATVHVGPADRRGALDKSGTEAVGGVVVVRYGENPLQVIDRVKNEIESISASLPSKLLDDGRVSQVTVVPFYDRTGLIRETLDTLNEALRLEVLVTLFVVLLMVAHVRSALLVASMLPLAILATFILMKYGGVDANVVALSGIAIAIGTLVDVGIVVTESIVKHVSPTDSPRQRLDAVLRGTMEVAGPVLTAILTTIVGFLPVFAMVGPEGKLFGPLAYTKTFALFASVVLALGVLPALAHFVLRARRQPAEAARPRSPGHGARVARWALAIGAAVLFALAWEPIGIDRPAANIAFTAVLFGGVLLAYALLLRNYETLLRWCLGHKLAFSTMPIALVAMGAFAWLGAERLLGPAGRPLAKTFPGLGREFMPRLDEGSFLLMPVTMVHASIGEALEMLQQQDRLVQSIPEVLDVVGKIGRVESPLDPAPVSMVETMIRYHPEYGVDSDGERVRLWRDHIRSSDDIWHEIEQAAAIPGMTSASMLQPIETRRIMLQTGMRSPLGVKVFGRSLEDLDRAALEIERHLSDAPDVRRETVIADRLVGKPYLEIDIDRTRLARYGLSVRAVQEAIEVAVGGKQLTTTVEGRERYSVRVRYMRELRDSVEALEPILIATPDGTQIPLGQLADIRYTPGPQNIKSEDSFLTAYVLFDKHPGVSEVEAVESSQRFLQERIDAGELELPVGVTYRFAGQYENQVRSAQTLRVVLPLALAVIFLILYLQFRSTRTTLVVFSGVFVAWAGGFLLLWLYGRDGFLDFELFGRNMRDLFQVGPVHLSVAVWVGFLALFGIATDDGVLMASYVKERLQSEEPRSIGALRDAVVHAGLRRIRPCLTTTATTTLALVPVLTSTGRGADIMVPMSIPTVGGMTVALVTIFVVPTLYCALEERRLRRLARQ